MKKKKKRNKSVLLRIMILGVCVYMLATLSGLWKTYNEKLDVYRELKAEYLEKSNNIEELKAVLADDSKVKLIEKAARERLGYVYPDEQIFVDISGN